MDMLSLRTSPQTGVAIRIPRSTFGFRIIF